MAQCKVAVVGGGIAGMAAAHALAKALGPGAVILLEREKALGGKIRTVHDGGWTIEEGPDSLLTTKPAGIALCEALGISESLRPAGARHAFVARLGKLHRLPSGLSGLAPASVRQILTTSLLGIPGRLRAALGAIPINRKSSADVDLTIQYYATRRFGAEAYQWIAEPVLAGIHAGDAARLSLSATFPQLASPQRLSARGKRSQFGSSFVAPASGMSALVGALEAALRDSTRSVEIVCGAKVTSIANSGHAFHVRTESHGETTAGAVVVAVPAWAAAPLLTDSFPTLAAQISEIPFVSTATISLGFAPGDVNHPLDGSGYVSPRARGGSVVACSWSSSKFPERAPEGSALLRVFIGRAGLEDPTLLPDDALIGIARRELKSTMGISAEPLITHVARWPLGLAQYEVGHSKRLKRMDALLEEFPGLTLTGHSYRGVGIPDCIESAYAAAGKVLSHIEG